VIYVIISAAFFLLSFSECNIDMECLWNKFFFLERRFLVKRLAPYLVKYYQSILKNICVIPIRPHEFGIVYNDVIYFYDHNYVFKKLVAATNEKVINTTNFIHFTFIITLLRYKVSTCFGHHLPTFGINNTCFCEYCVQL
jgi:hypothetical protein